jgi:glycerate 2-kinase
MDQEQTKNKFIENFSQIANNDRRRAALKYLSVAMRDLDPEIAIERYRSHVLSFLSNGGNVTVLGFGKAAVKMYRGIYRILGEKISTGAIIIPEDDTFSADLTNIEVLRGTHPYSTALSEASSRRLLEIAEHTPDEHIIFLVSGGGSAIFEIPAEPFDIEQISAVSKCMMNNGAGINDLNCVRFAMSSVKGGKLAARLKDHKMLALYISDVPYDDLSYIASGPLISAHGSCDPTSILAYTGCSGDLPNATKLSYNPPAPAPDLRNLLILRNYDFVSKISGMLRAEGEEVVDLGSNMNGDVVDFVQHLITMIRSIGSIRNRGFWFVGGGETTVIVHGNGKGGRSQAAALHFLLNMKEDEDFLFLTAGTDGIDGQSPAMGAIVDNETKSQVSNDKIEKYLKNDDSYTLLSAIGSAILTGRTGNNVSDIFFGYYSRHEEKEEA